MMFHYKELLFAMLLSSTTATFLRQDNENPEASVTLGATFLAAANNYTTGTPIIETSATINAQLEAEAIPSVADAFRTLCLKHGHVEHEQTSHGDPNYGGSTWSNINCRIPMGMLDIILTSARTMIEDADGTTVDSSISSYVSHYSNPSSLLAQKKGLEQLLKKAETIEEVMLIVPSWQNVVSQFYPTTNTSVVSVNLNQLWDWDFPNATDDSLFPAPAAAPTFDSMKQRSHSHGHKKK
jgi:hypothetical protein